ncbi:MAG TPA: ABC transporter transmembrane domain-containing protein, partial [Hyphomicrobiales bacterium]|nr:ABC transporter transmembrane domain-containing protein [Hyphomicrobiales bacterium]
TTLVLPVAVRRMIDHGFSNAESAFIDRYFMMLLAVAGALAIASSCRYYLVTWLGDRIVSDLRRDVFSHVARLDMSFFDSARSGEVISRLTADTTQIKAAVGASASVALRNLVLFIGAIIMMVVTSPHLSGLVLAAIPFIVLPIVAFGRAVRKKSRHAQDTLAEAAAYASEAISSIRTLQAYTNEPHATARFAADVERAFEAARSSTASRALLTAFAIFMVFGSVVVVMWIGATSVLEGTLSAGALGQFVLYSVFAAGALGELSQVWAEIAQASGAAERLSELLAVEPKIVAPASPKALPSPATGALAFDKVSFAYGEAGVLDGIDFSVAPGDSVAFVGPSGAGKSTIFHLIMRYYDPTAGRILLDGVDLRDADPQELRRRIAVVPQETMIFAASVMDNIRYGRPEASDADVIRAAEAALADEFVRNMADGYDTMVGERGVTLSGGQRQRIAIARAILKDAPLLLLDEATSALDAESETLVQIALEHLMAGRTTLVIAHRLATVLKANRILVMEKGRIVETGSHDDLVKGSGLYARLAKLQFETGAAALNGGN